MAEVTYEELVEAKEELEALKSDIDESIENLKDATKITATSLIMRSVIATCAYKIVTKVADTFLPKQLSGPVKAAVTFGTFFIPEIAANAASNLTEKILEE